MRAISILAGLLALLALAIGLALWTSRAPPAPAAPDPIAPEVAEPPDADLRESEARAEVSGTTPVPAPTPQVEPQTVGSAAVAGWLRVAGQPPGETVALQLGSLRAQGARTIAHDTRATPDGAFRFEGVAEDWSGAIVLPDHYRLARPEEHGGDAHGFTAHAGQLDLVLDVERLPLLRGRALAADGSPAAGVFVRIQAGQPNGSTVWASRADATGRFERMLRTHEIQSLEISGRSDDGGALMRAWTQAELPALDSRGDMDLGDLRLAPSDAASVLVLDPDGAPFGGARVIEVADTGARPVVTGPDGVANVQLAANVQGFEVHADGFALVELPRPAPGERLVAHLSKSNVLTVEVLDVLGDPWPHGILHVSASQPVFEGGRDVPSTAVEGSEPGQFYETGRDREGSYAKHRLGPTARVDWPGLVVGLAFELTLEDAVGTRGAQERVPGLAAGEQRSVRLQLARATRVLTGRCVDTAGNPVAGARVHLSVPKARSTELTTGADGAFAGPPLLAERVRVRGYAEGYVDRRLEDVALPADLTLVLERGRTLQVRLRDAAGAPSGLGQLRLRDPASGQTWNARRAATSPGADSTGPQDFAGVPNIGLELVHTWHERTRTVAVPDHVEEFVWDLPELGRLEVEVGACAIGELESGYLLLEALDGRGVVQQELLTPGAAGDFRFEPWPGRYRLKRVIHSFTADAEGWRTPAGERLVGESVEVEVALGRIAQAVLAEVP